jgi:hypothetical protein
MGRGTRNSSTPHGLRRAGWRAKRQHRPAPGRTWPCRH